MSRIAWKPTPTTLREPGGRAVHQAPRRRVASVGIGGEAPERTRHPFPLRSDGLARFTAGVYAGDQLLCIRDGFMPAA